MSQKNPVLKLVDGGGITQKGIGARRDEKTLKYSKATHVAVHIMTINAETVKEYKWPNEQSIIVGCECLLFAYHPFFNSMEHFGVQCSQFNFDSVNLAWDLVDKVEFEKLMERKLRESINPEGELDLIDSKSEHDSDSESECDSNATDDEY